MTKATWADIPGYGGLYQISTDGIVFSDKRQGSQGGIRSQYTDKQGYKRVSLTKDGKTRSYLIHTLIALTFLGERPKAVEVCHKDGDKNNNTVQNLYYGSRSENSQDSVRHGTHNFLKHNFTGEYLAGENCNWAKLTEDAVRYIKQMKGQKSSRLLAKELNVSQGSISAVWCGKSWRHVQ